jgi:hypothetical protein
MASAGKDEVAKNDDVADKKDAPKPDELEDEVKLSPEEAVRVAHQRPCRGSISCSADFNSSINSSISSKSSKLTARSISSK